METSHFKDGVILWPTFEGESIHDIFLSLLQVNVWRHEAAENTSR